MKTIKNTCYVSLILMLLSSEVFALHESQGLVKSIKASGGTILFSVCNNTGCDNFWLKPDNDYKNVVVSMLISAKVSERLVWVGGSDTPNDEWPYNGSRAFMAMDFKG